MGILSCEDSFIVALDDIEKKIKILTIRKIVINFRNKTQFLNFFQLTFEKINDQSLTHQFPEDPLKVLSGTRPIFVGAGIESDVE